MVSTAIQRGDVGHSRQQILVCIRAKRYCKEHKFCNKGINISTFDGDEMTMVLMMVMVMVTAMAMVMVGDSYGDVDIDDRSQYESGSTYWGIFGIVLEPWQQPEWMKNRRHH